MDAITGTLVQLIRKTDLDRRPDLLQQSKIAFLDYLASALQASRHPRVEKVARWVGSFPGDTPLLGQTVTSNPIQAAFFNGFQSHYLDLDDAQSSIAGHFSTVLFSVLLAEYRPETSVQEFLTAYTVGAEIEGLLGGYLNPKHKQQGWHSTGTLGSIGGAAALAKLYGLEEEAMARLLSLGATQSAGLGLEAGSDAKPLHSGFAARNAVFAFELLQHTGVTASQRPFNNQNGWQKVFGNLELDSEKVKQQWLQPGQLLEPGLWMKLHPYCSAAIGGAAACKELYKQGLRLDGLQEVTFHFPPGADTALHYPAPATGKEGKFSMEYVGWQVLSRGGEDDDLFELAQVPETFQKALPKFHRKNDLPPVEKTVRRTVVTATDLNGKTYRAEVPDPLGSPQHPFSEQDLKEKLVRAKGECWTENLLKKMESWPEGRLDGIRDLL
ncbi:MmgE/PrpD family protein [Acidaminococcus sp.]|uniref:MmgE/PrpD family protein n=1 Tax=Acidaminococcus sp. TaxID=1872103 RepID=UPI003D7D0F00